MSPPLTVAVAGDVHGNHRALIERLTAWNRANQTRPLALVLQVGDFEPHRDEADLAAIPGSAARRALGDFPEVVAGRLQYPAELLFIGGNREPWGWLEEFRAGGTLLPGITFLGRAGRAERHGLRIAALSGIHSPTRYDHPLPADWLARKGTLKEPSYFRRPEVEWLRNSGPADILLTHDWPRGLIGPFGNPQSRALLETLRPQYHVAGHMHRSTRQTVAHPDGSTSEFVALNQVGMGRRGVLFLEWNGARLREIGWDEP